MTEYSTKPFIDVVTTINLTHTLNFGRDEVSVSGADEIPVIIILVVCIVGVFILALNVGLILFFIQRRKKRLEAGHSDTPTHTNTFELYGTTKVDHHLGPPGSDDTRSYGTYDKNDMDDFSDDYIRDYETNRPPPPRVDTYQSFVGGANLLPKVLNCDRGEDKEKPSETHVFLPPQSEYPVESRPYSPHIQQSDPHSPGRTHKMTYLLEDHNGRHSPWNDEPQYKVSLPRHGKKGQYENGVPNGDVYEFKSSRAKNLNELSDHSSSRPSSRSGSSILSPNIVSNPSYCGPASNNHLTPSMTPSPRPNHHSPTPHELRGHLV